MADRFESMETVEGLDDLSLGHRAEIGRLEEALFGAEAEVVRVGRFTVRGVVGRGAFGTVYEAEDPELARKVALKVLATSDERAQTKLLQEARLMATVTHPNIATVYEVGTFEHDGETKVFVAMEFVAGTTLRGYLEDESRRGREIVALLVQAGRGLAAAHCAGIIHRDFKPDNVLVGADGRVRVVDFGLASSTPQSGPGLPEVDGSAPIDAATRTRGLAGTPAYMAPETFDGAPADALSDQFSFCVAAHEALYGRRPFEGGTFMALAANVSRGQIIEAPAKSDVSASLRRIIVRGLQSSPADRYPDMDALLGDLEPETRRWTLRRQLVAVGAVAAVIGVAAGATLSRRSLAPVRDCELDVTAVDAVWTDGRAAAIEASFQQATPALGKATSSRIASRIDAYAQRWRMAAAAACERSIPSEDAQRLRGLQGACLGRASDRLDALLAEFEHADAAMVTQAIRSVRALPDLTRCLDAAALLAAAPERPADQAKVDEIRRTLDVVANDYTAGRYDAARERLDGAARDAEAIGFDPIVAEVKNRLAQLDLKAGRYPSSRTLAREAFDRALAASDERLAVAATIVLAQAGVADPNHLDEGLSWVQTGQSLLARVGEVPRLESGLALARASLLITAVDKEKTTGALEEAARILRAEDPQHPDLPVVLGNWGTWLLRLGQPSEAIAKYEEAIETAQSTLGPNHPDVAQWLLGLGSASMTVGDLAAAERYLNRSLDLHREAVGEGHPNTIQTLMYLGVLEHNRNAYPKSIEHFDTALRSAQTHLGSEHPIVAEVCLRFADTLSLAGRHEEAERTAGLARRIYEGMLPEGDPRLAPVYGVGLVTATRAGRLEDGLAQGRRGLAVAGTRGDRDPMTVNLLHETGKVLLELDQSTEAIELLDRAAAALADGVEEPRRRALVAFELAKARWPKERDAARRHAVEARQWLPEGAPATEREAIETWIDEHGPAAGTVAVDGR